MAALFLFDFLFFSDTNNMESDLQIPKFCTTAH